MLKVRHIRDVFNFFAIFLAVLVLGTGNSAYATEFFINTKDGIGVADKFGIIEYRLGFPYSEFDMLLRLAPGDYINLKFSGGYDFRESSYSFKVGPLFRIGNFELDIPFSLDTKYMETDTAMEVGRMYIGLSPSYFIKDAGVKFQVNAYYSALYLYYDPAFNVNIPTFRTDDIFRSKLDFNVRYLGDGFSIGLGYVTSLRWLSYRSFFITGDNSVYFDARFAITF
ncbi:MAG: hypothetical protein WBJ29_00495 [Fervidobacterium sp.]